MMAEYTVRDDRPDSPMSGKTVTFQWHDEQNPPTDADIEQVFADAAKSQRTTGQEIATAVSPYARPLLEAGGALVGGSLGAGGGTLVAPGAGSVVGGVAGAGLGYAAGRELADRIDEYAGTRKTVPLPWQFVNTGKNVVEGAGMEAGGQVAGKVLPFLGKQVAKAARPVMRSAIKPSTVDQPEITDAAIDTLIQYGIIPTRAGLKKIRGFLDNVLGLRNRVIEEMPQTMTVTTATPGRPAPFKPVMEPAEHGAGFTVRTGEKSFVSDASGTPMWYRNEAEAKKIADAITTRPAYQKALQEAQPVVTTTERGALDMTNVVKAADEAKALYSDLPIAEKQQYIKEIEDVKRAYLSDGPNITPKAAEKMKEAIYRLLREHYDKLQKVNPKISPAGAEARMGVARGIKEALEEIDPTVGFYNQKLSDLLRAKQYLERGMGRISNLDPISLTDSIFAASGAAAANPPLGLGVAAANKAVRSARGRGLAALALARAGRSQGMPTTSRALMYGLLRSDYE